MTLIRRRLQDDWGVTLGIAVALVLSYPATMIAALWPNVWVFTVFALIGYVAEAAAVRHASHVSAALTQVGLGLTLRSVVREAALLLLLARGATLDTGWIAAVAIGLMFLHVVRAAHSSAVVLVTQRRRLPMLTRGINLSPLRIPAPPPRLLTRQHTRTMLHLDVPVVAGALIGMSELTALLAAVADGDDPMAERRRELRNHLLGPDAPDAGTRFAQAIDALIKAE
ncbi:hypothetical protein AB0M44_29230 [Streptosporangium subroseum]|uniref:hypothetical protein n=1 Tax=Streptosporangium subroseum TaxID=106412 RepID=UPI0034247BA3